MPKLTGLIGIKKKCVDGYFVSSVSQAMEELKYYRAVTCAGDCGSITAWKDDAGVYRAEFSRRLSAVSLLTSPSQRGLRDWLKTHWPMLHSEVRS